MYPPSEIAVPCASSTATYPATIQGAKWHLVKLPVMETKKRNIREYTSRAHEAILIVIFYTTYICKLRSVRALISRMKEATDVATVLHSATQCCWAFRFLLNLEVLLGAVLLKPNRLRNYWGPVNLFFIFNMLLDV